MLIQTIGYRVEAPGATVTDCEPVPGDSLEVGMAEAGSKVALLDWLPVGESAGEHRLVWSSGHDTSYGVSAVGLADFVPGWISPTAGAKLRPGEVIRAAAAGGSTAGKYSAGMLTLYYESLPGVAGRYITADELRSRCRQVLGHVMSITTTAVASWNATEPLDASRNVWKAEAEYAFLGAQPMSNEMGVALRGPDTGNVRVACPNASYEQRNVHHYFERLSLESGLACIPVIRGGNVGGTFVDVLEANSTGTKDLYLLFAELES